MKFIFTVVFTALLCNLHAQTALLTFENPTLSGGNPATKFTFTVRLTAVGSAFKLGTTNIAWNYPNVLLTPATFAIESENFPSQYGTTTFTNAVATGNGAGTNNNALRVNTSFTGSAGTGMDITTSGVDLFTVSWTITSPGPNAGTADFIWRIGTASQFANPRTVINNDANQAVIHSGNNLLSQPLFLAPLPLDLTSFTGQTLERTNMLQWETQTEKDVKAHLVERTIDGIIWTEVGRISGQLNSNTLRHYQLEDLAPLPKAYYRLRSIDLDGQENKSNTILLTRKSDHFGITSVFPSPTVDNVTVQFTSLQEETVTIRVLDLTGRLVLTQTVDAVQDLNERLLQLTGLQAGMYTVTITDSAGVSAPVRFIKQ